jgi:hypothetical protein
MSEVGKKRKKGFKWGIIGNKWGVVPSQFARVRQEWGIDLLFVSVRVETISVSGSGLRRVRWSVVSFASEPCKYSQIALLL